MKIYQTSDIRNIALVGGAKSGKTTMAEAMAFNGGVINRRGTVEDKNTISDYRDIAEEFGAEQVIYAHCHGERRFHDSIEGTFRGREYHLVSGDFLRWVPKMII